MKKVKGLAFWDREDFKGRVIKVITKDKTELIPVPDDEVVCDLCNARITKFPVAVYRGNVLCPNCLVNVLVWGEE